MDKLLTFNWSGIDYSAGLKATVGLLIVLLLGAATGQPWVLSGLVVLFAWLTTVPGSTIYRLMGIAAFGIGAAVLSLVSDQIGLTLVPNLFSIAIVGFLGTAALALGLRAYMVGYVLICWMIYTPFLISGSSSQNALLAILLGCAIMAVMTMLPDWFAKDPKEAVSNKSDVANNDWGFAVLFGATVAIVLIVGTYLGWTQLTTDATLIVGGAFFIIGFDTEKTWIAGLARVIAIVAGSYLGFWLAQSGAGPQFLQAVALVAVFLAFASGAVHPGAFMFFFLIALGIGWASLSPSALETTANERLWGETIGVVLGMAAIFAFELLYRRKTSSEANAG